MSRVLLLGAGSARDRRVVVNGRQTFEGQEVVSLDMNPDHGVDVVWDLEDERPLPFPDDSFGEIHAYEVLEHIGAQGDYRTFFRQFSDYWRVLEPGGFFAATVPYWKSVWAWGDPSHKRVIPLDSLVFLNQAEYTRQVGRTPMSDFRFCYRADFEPVPGGCGIHHESSVFLLRAVKPSRCSL